MLNLIGLVFVTLGALLAMFTTPGTSLNPDGSTSLAPLATSGPESKKHRIRKYWAQKIGFPLAFSLIMVGSGLQLWAAITAL